MGMVVGCCGWCHYWYAYILETYKNALNYGSADGSENLRRAIKEYYSRNRIGGLTADVLSKKKICIGANGATSLLDSIAEIMPKGIVITTDPNYYIYIETLQRKGFTICAIPEDSDGMRVDVLEEQLKTIAISLSLSTISFKATLCTLPALLPSVLDCINLESLNPIILSNILLVS